MPAIIWHGAAVCRRASLDPDNTVDKADDVKDLWDRLMQPPTAKPVSAKAAALKKTAGSERQHAGPGRCVGSGRRSEQTLPFAVVVKSGDRQRLVRVSVTMTWIISMVLRRHPSIR
jgi:hypothetical protein